MAISLASIARGPRMKAPKIVIYGVGGIGKTDFAAHAPSPVFLFTEEGQGILGMPRFELRKDDPIIRDWGELNACIDFLMNEEHDFRTVVIDTIDFAEPLLWRHVTAVVPHEKGGFVKSIEDYGFGKGYVHAVDHARPFLQKLDDLRTRRGMAIILIAHAHTRRHEPPDAESYERYQLKLQDRLAHVIYDWADCVLFAAYKSYVTKDKESFNNERRRALVGQGERVIYTQERPPFWAKNRYGLPFEMPFQKDAAWATFQDAVTASLQAHQSQQPQLQPQTATPKEEQ